MINQNELKEIKKEILSLAQNCEKVRNKITSLQLLNSETDTIPYTSETHCYQQVTTDVLGLVNTTLIRMYGALVLYNDSREIDIDKQ